MMHSESGDDDDDEQIQYFVRKYMFVSCVG